MNRRRSWNRRLVEHMICHNRQTLHQTFDRTLTVGACKEVVTLPVART